MTIGSEMLQTTPNTVSPSVAIIGGGVAGATAAVHMSELGLNVLLLEKGPGLVNGPPICHLHAGGNLYREISQQQCVELLRQSIETVRLYPHTLNKRPTVIAVPHTDPGQPEEILPRLSVIQDAYQSLVDEDPRNQILGAPQAYYQTFDRAQLEALALKTQPQEPTTIEEWLIPFAQHADLSTLKYPVVAVQEYGWSVFRLAASAELVLASLDNCQVLTNATLVASAFVDNQWQLTYQDKNGHQHQLVSDYLVNACGFETGKVDDMTRFSRQRLVEFKAAYVTHWPQCQQQWPEVIFHGPRGTPQGMAQLTPYADGVFQLHGMTQGITLFEDGLVASNGISSQPQLPGYLANKITQGWQADATRERTERAIEHMSQFVPDFARAEVGGKPLFGAQQIPGEDATLRAADVTFEARHYARIEVVKGSSALEAARKIVAEWQLADEQVADSIEAQHPVSMSLSAEQVERKALQLADERGYPQALAKVVGMA
ncbi:FAD-dependent oxidoreductase [Vibrio fluvialis]|uniref:FAD-dependent oxidoreductase n=1 Tax=Vibrio fluvialis TaxID=676 RepID=UPI00192CDECC|nr:FAD-dependent oxidoreductase [Vibrio fluvialis]MBL4304392.1 FAD-dependent oxidoreductase [Vibrio fluvialis]MBY8093460.1 FAD-dependent oxidoreductase [Vibrio fluvialis]MCG6361280.1 FAD-dependent oxidoreductase [Vibrio fluvialis]